MERGQVARRVVPELDRVDVELRAAFPPALGDLAQVLQQILFRRPDNRRRVGRQRIPAPRTACHGRGGRGACGCGRRRRSSREPRPAGQPRRPPPCTGASRPAQALRPDTAAKRPGRFPAGRTRPDGPARRSTRRRGTAESPARRPRPSPGRGIAPARRSRPAAAVGPCWPIRRISAARGSGDRSDRRASRPGARSDDWKCKTARSDLGGNLRRPGRLENDFSRLFAACRPPPLRVHSRREDRRLVRAIWFCQRTAPSESASSANTREADRSSIRFGGAGGRRPASAPCSAVASAIKVRTAHAIWSCWCIGGRSSSEKGFRFTGVRIFFVMAAWSPQRQPDKY